MKAWCTRVSVGAVREVFNLGHDKRRAEQLDREVRARLIAEASASDVRAFLKKELRGNGAPDPVPPPIVVPSAPVADAVGQHFATFRDLIRVCIMRALEAKPEVSRRYLFCLLNLVEGTLLYRSGKEPRDRSGRRAEYEDYDAILDLPLTILDNLLVADFKHWRLERARRQGDDEISAKISANTEIRQATSAIRNEVLLACRSAGLHLPSFESFLNAPKFKKCKRLRPLPHERVVKHLHEELAMITDEGLFLAIAVALHRGLRHGEILAMHHSWLQRTTGPSLVVRTSVDFSSKNYGERTVPLPEWLYERLMARGPGYLIAADASERERTLDRAVAWVRQHGLEDSLKPLHALRALCAGYLLARYPLLTVLDILGHQDIRTTINHYSKVPLAADLAALWDVVLPSKAAGKTAA
jgi:integrase